MSKLIKNYMYNVMYQFFLIMVPLVTAPYLSRVFTSKTLGVYGYVNSVVSIIATLGMLGLQNYGSRQIAYNRDDEEIVSQSFSSIFLLRIILLFIITIFYIPFCFFSKYKMFFLIQYILILAQFLDISWVFIGFEDLGIVTIRNFIAKLITVISIFIFIREDSDLWKYFIIFSFITFITTITIYFLLNRYVKFKKVNIKESLKHLLPAIKLFLPQIATLLYLQVDKIMIGKLTASTSQIAYYEYAEKIVLIPLAIITALNTVLMPRIANLFVNNNYKKIEEYMNKSISFALFLSIPMMFGLMGIARGLMPWYLGEEYIFSAYAIIILSPLCVFNTISSILGAQYLTATNQTKVLTLTYYSTAVVNIILNIFLIPKFGYIGAAIATLVSSFISILIQYFFVKKEIKFNVTEGIIKNLFSSLIMFFGIFFLSSYMKISPLSTLIEIVIGVICYVGFEILLNDKMLLYILKKGIELLWRKK
jgi:O-antigen/teichoic acid export membrane protein